MSRSSSCSRASPVDLRKPAIALSGASARGPRRSSLVPALAAARSRAIRTRRRGVTKPSTAPTGSPAAAVPAVKRSRSCSIARACIRAGISSVRSSRRKSVTCVLSRRRERTSNAPADAARSEGVRRSSGTVVAARRRRAYPHPPRQRAGRLSRRRERKRSAGHDAHPFFATQASATALVRSRTRPMYAARSATLMTPRAFNRLKTWLALIAWS